MSGPGHSRSDRRKPKSATRSIHHELFSQQNSLLFTLDNHFNSSSLVKTARDTRSTVPCRATTRYTTFVENQTGVDINVYQGERELTKDCRLLGQFQLRGIPPMPAQLPQVDVTFLVDADGLLTVSAKEQRSGQQVSVTVQPAHGLSKEEIERLVLESVEHAHGDFRARLLIELQNKADAELRHTEKALAAADEQLTPGERTAVEAAVSAVH